MMQWTFVCCAPGFWTSCYQNELLLSSVRDVQAVLLLDSASLACDVSEKQTKMGTILYCCAC